MRMRFSLCALALVAGAFFVSVAGAVPKLVTENVRWRNVNSYNVAGPAASDTSLHTLGGVGSAADTTAWIDISDMTLPPIAYHNSATGRDSTANTDTLIVGHVTVYTDSFALYAPTASAATFTIDVAQGPQANESTADLIGVGVFNQAYVWATTSRSVSFPIIYTPTRAGYLEFDPRAAAGVGSGLFGHTRIRIRLRSWTGTILRARCQISLYRDRDLGRKKLTTSDLRWLNHNLYNQVVNTTAASDTTRRHLATTGSNADTTQWVDMSDIALSPTSDYHAFTLRDTGSAVVTADTLIIGRLIVFTDSSYVPTNTAVTVSMDVDRPGAPDTCTVLPVGQQVFTNAYTHATGLAFNALSFPILWINYSGAQSNDIAVNPSGSNVVNYWGNARARWRLSSWTTGAAPFRHARCQVQLWRYEPHK